MMQSGSVPLDQQRGWSQGGWGALRLNPSPEDHTEPINPGREYVRFLPLCLFHLQHIKTCSISCSISSVVFQGSKDN